MFMAVDGWMLISHAENVREIFHQNGFEMFSAMFMDGDSSGEEPSRAGNV